MSKKQEGKSVNRYTYGTKLKKIRKHQHLSQKELAHDICSQAMLSRIENNDVIPNVVIMQQLCHRLNVSLDDIVSSDDTTFIHSKNQTKDVLKQMRYLHQTQQYHQLLRIIESFNPNKSLKADDELQIFYYYYACALSYLEQKAPEEILEIFQKSLAYTFSHDKDFVTDMEVLILCEIGKTYLAMDKTEMGVSNLSRSFTFLQQHSRKRLNIELVRVFYTIGLSYTRYQEYDLAKDIVNQGIQWAQERQVSYYLDELFLLKGIVSQKPEKIEEAFECIHSFRQLRNQALEMEANE